MAPSISPSAAAALRTYIDDATTGEPPRLPGAIVQIIDGKNNTLFSHASGGSILLSAEKSVFLLHSITKIVGTIAFMQLVDRGLATLDDPAIIEKHLLELWSKKVLTGFEGDGKTPILVDRTTDITPRMLMNHTNGTGHTFFNPLMNKYLAEGWETRNEVVDPHQTILDAPLMWQPGTHTNYGQGFDWLAVLIERLSGQNLAAYFEQHIFGPLGLKTIGFEETYGGDVTSRPENAGNFWPRSFKQPDGTFTPIDPPVLATVSRKNKSFPEGPYHAFPLGTGLAGTASELARLLTILVEDNSGVDPVSGTRILSAEAVKQITTPQLPEEVRNATRVV
ncbi:beta-lactamase/transpeptidase-like protein, partial [Lophiotrema nucula]